MDYLVQLLLISGIGIYASLITIYQFFIRQKAAATAADRSQTPLEYVFDENRVLLRLDPSRRNVDGTLEHDLYDRLELIPLSYRHRAFSNAKATIDLLNRESRSLLWSLVFFAVWTAACVWAMTASAQGFAGNLVATLFGLFLFVMFGVQLIRVAKARRLVGEYDAFLEAEGILCQMEFTQSRQQFDARNSANPDQSPKSPDAANAQRPTS